MLADLENDLFGGTDPHAYIEAQRRQQEETSSDEDESSESEHELTNELMAGFEDNIPENEAQRRQQEDTSSDKDDGSESEDELTKEIIAGFEDDEEETSQSSSQYLQSYDTAIVTSPFPMLYSQSSPEPLVIPTVQTFARITEDTNDEADESNDRDQEFEDVPLFTTVAAAPAIAPVQIPEQSSRRRSRKQAPTHNADGLPIRRDAEGTEIGYKEAPPPQHAYAWDSDTAIPEEDPYFAKGCVRRMVFTSDPVPPNQQYKAPTSQHETNATATTYFTAADKVYDWNRTRRGVIGATEETLRDGKLPRHFILKLGAPNGPKGDAIRVAERLAALIKHYFHGRLAKSHVTLEIDIPYIKLAGISYFEKYIDKVREVMGDIKLRDRLTVQLATESAQRYIDCDPTAFYHPDIDHETKWTNKIERKEYTWALLQRGGVVPMPETWVPTPWEIDDAKQTFLKSSRITEAEQKGHTHQAIEKIKEFVQFVRDKGADPEHRQSPAPAPAPAPSPAPLPTWRPSMQEPTAVEYHNSPIEVLQHVQVYDASSAPQPSSTSTDPLGQPPLPAPRNPEAPRFLPRAGRYGGRQDQYSTVMSFGDTPEQQARNISHMLADRDRQYHRGMQLEQMRQYQQQRAQQRGPPEASAVGSPASTLGKRGGDDDLDEPAEKRSK